MNGRCRQTPHLLPRKTDLCKIQIALDFHTNPCLFENLVVVEALKSRLNAGREPELYYIRDQSRMEIDLVLRKRRRLYPIEIKAAMTRQPEQARHLESFRKTAGAVMDRAAVVYGGELEVSVGGSDWITPRSLARWMEAE